MNKLFDGISKIKNLFIAFIIIILNEIIYFFK